MCFQVRLCERRKTQLDYKTIKRLHDAQEFVQQYRSHPVTKKVKDRTYNVPNDYYWYGSGQQPLALSYSQQETVIYRSYVYRDYEEGNLLLMYPTGVGRKYFRHIDKEYVYFNDANGTQRYYIVPEEGLRIQKDGDGYKAMNPIPDYRIEVDRNKAKAARKPIEDFYQYIDTLWDMVPELEYNQRPQYRPRVIPKMDDRESWFKYISDAKNAKWERVSKETLLQKLRSHYTQTKLAYKVTQVPDTETDHTEHWPKLQELREAGLLEVFEGPVKKPRGKKKTKKAGSSR